MSCDNFEEEILRIDMVLDEAVNKLDFCKTKNEKMILNNKIKENIDELISTLLISKQLIHNTLYEIKFNNCLHSLHNYIDDFIDIHPELSQKITYCKHCGISKNE